MLVVCEENSLASYIVGEFSAGGKYVLSVGIAVHFRFKNDVPITVFPFFSDCGISLGEDCSFC